MRTKKVFCKNSRWGFYGFFLSMLISTAGCSRQEDLMTNTELVVSWTAEPVDDVSDINVSIEGQKDTLYVFTNDEFDVFFQTGYPEDWIQILSKEYLGDMGATRIILASSPLADTYRLRSGMLTISNKAKYAGRFIRIAQGYGVRFSEDFSWLKYGVANPFDLDRDQSIKKWNPTQTAVGWTSTVGDGEDEAYAYGRFEHIRLGTDRYGADLLSPIIPGIEKDSILLLSFNAVSYVSRLGERDGNKLTVELLNGCLFADGTDTKVLDLGFYDHQTPLIVARMWEESLFAFEVVKPATNIGVSTIQLRLTTGDDLSQANNRVFVDDIYLYVVEQYME